MLGQKCSEQFFPFTFSQFLFHHKLRYDRESIPCHPNFDDVRLGMSPISNHRIGSLQSCGFRISQEFPRHLSYQNFILLRKIVTMNTKIVQNIFVPYVTMEVRIRT
jgi:hypothetical protein